MTKLPNEPCHLSNLRLKRRGIHRKLSSIYKLVKLSRFSSSRVVSIHSPCRHLIFHSPGLALSATMCGGGRIKELFLAAPRTSKNLREKTFPVSLKYESRYEAELCVCACALSPSSANTQRDIRKVFPLPSWGARQVERLWR
jgi:hypothetical protein